jgi:hypothetical protein
MSTQLLSIKFLWELKFLPVGSPAEPLQVVEQEWVVGRSAMHVAVGDDSAGVADRNANSVFRLLQDQQVGLIVANQKLEKWKKKVKKQKKFSKMKYHQDHIVRREVYNINSNVPIRETVFCDYCISWCSPASGSRWTWCPKEFG